jgi:ribosome maturation factor RimP
MKYTPREDDPLFDSLKAVVEGLGLSLLELTVSRHRGSVQVRLVLYKAGDIGIEDCSRVHQGVLPRLDLAFPGQEVYLEVSSPGIGRQIRDAAEFPMYLGRGIRCYRTDTSAWTEGLLKSADEERLVLAGKDGEIVLNYGIIGKAKLEHAQEVDAYGH